MDAISMSYSVPSDSCLLKDQTVSWHPQEISSFSFKETYAYGYDYLSSNNCLNETKQINKLTTVLKRTRRAKRVVINRSHLITLEAKFQLDPKPSQQLRNELAKTLELPERSILVWFQNRRTKARANGEMPAVNSTPKSIRSTWSSTARSSTFPPSPYITESNYISETYCNINYNSINTPLLTHSELDSLYSNSYINPVISSSFGDSYFINYSQFQPPCYNLLDISSLDSFTSPTNPV